MGQATRGGLSAQRGQARRRDPFTRGGFRGRTQQWNVGQGLGRHRAVRIGPGHLRSPAGHSPLLPQCTPGHQGLTQSGNGGQHGPVTVPGDRVGGEDHAGGPPRRSSAAPAPAIPLSAEIGCPVGVVTGCAVAGDPRRGNPKSCSPGSRSSTRIGRRREVAYSPAYDASGRSSAAAEDRAANGPAPAMSTAAAVAAPSASTLPVTAAAVTPTRAAGAVHRSHVTCYPCCEASY